MPPDSPGFRLSVDALPHPPIALLLVFPLESLVAGAICAPPRIISLGSLIAGPPPDVLSSLIGAQDGLGNFLLVCAV
jgi:hypothetical protein